MNVFRCHVLLPRLKSKVHNILTKDEVLRINLNIGGVLITSTSHPPFLTLLNLSPFHLVPLLRYLSIVTFTLPHGPCLFYSEANNLDTRALWKQVRSELWGGRDSAAIHQAR